MTTSFKSVLRDSNASLNLVEESTIPDIKLFEIIIPNPKKMCFYQVWNEKTPQSNAKPFKTFVLNPSLFVAALDTFKAANPDVFYYPTIVIEIKEKLYYVQAINFSFNQDKELKYQIRKASISVTSNIAEGFDSNFDREFSKFLVYSRRSCSEIQSCLYIALDQNYIEQKKFDECYNQAKKTAKLVGGFIKYLNNS